VHHERDPGLSGGRALTSLPSTSLPKGGPTARPSIVRPALGGLTAALLLLTVAGSSIGLGHEGGPRLILEPERVRPGGVLTIRLEDLPPERLVDLAITGSAGSVPLASVPVDPEGHATVFVEVPADLPLGTYTVNATAESVDVAGASVTVEGAPIAAGGEPGQKDEDDMLLVPLPSGWQQSLSGPIVTARPLTETLPAGSGSRLAIEGVVAVIAAVLVLGSIGFVLTSRLRRRV
jgi:hypothetical protein